MWTIAIAAMALTAMAAPVCDDNVVLTVATTAVNIVVPEDLNITSTLNLSATAAQALVKTFPKENINGSYKIAGRYCKPEVSVPSRASTIQLLVHGVGYTRNYWSGEGLPGSAQQVNGTMYSWVDYASQQGYPTFSIDRLCNGESTHIASVLCQNQLNAATIRDVAVQLRAGAVAGTKFSKVIYVGHSLGSTIGQIVTQLYPQDFEAVVLTGYSLRLINGFLGTVASYLPLPAAAILPAEYGNLDPGYLVSATRQGFEQVFFYGNYLESLIDIDFARRGPLAIGELLTALLGQLPAAGFTGKLMVLTGQEDEVFCATNPVGAVLSVPADCGSGSTSASAQVQSLYPDVKVFSWYQTQSSGHCLNLHTNANVTFEQAHKFINAV